jgi:hypothetical protein
MKRHILIIGIMIGFFAWFGLSTSVALAQGIPPVDAAGFPIPGSPVTVSLFQDSTDVTAEWLPVPGQPVEIVINPPGDYTISLVPSAAADPIAAGVLATSAYPGDATNYGSSIADDFTLSGNLLTALDHGGMAVIRVVTGSGDEYLFILPRDDDFDGIATIFESLNCPSGNCARNADIDTGPDGLSPSGDGFANIDEYKGWRVSGQYVRGNPQVKDIFLHLEDTVQCDTTAGSFPGDGGTLVDLDFFFPTSADLDDLFANVNTLSPAMNVHRINSDEWVDNFDHYDRLSRVQLTGSSPENAITDRWINQNAIVPLGAEDPTVPSTGRRFVKGVRVVQCLDLFQLTPLGRADKDPPDKFDSDNGNAVLFIHRIINSFLNKISAGGSRDLAYYTFESGRWRLQSPTFSAPSDPNDVSDASVQAIIKIALAWYLAHEALEHSFDVTDTAEGTRKVSYGYHHAEGTGTNVDLKIVHKVDKKASGLNKFYISKFHGISDKREIRVLSDQVVP